MPFLEPEAHFRASLMDRLRDDRPQESLEAVPLRALTREALKQSILQNLEWILNSRAPDPRRWKAAACLTVIDYGMPDFGATSPENLEHRTELERIMTRCLTHFEPRLRKVQVRVEKTMPTEKSLRVRITAVPAADPASDPLSFETIYQDTTGVWEFHESE